MQKIKNKIRERETERERKKESNRTTSTVSFFYNMLIGQAIKAKPSFILGQYQLRQLAFFFKYTSLK